MKEGKVLAAPSKTEKETSNMFSGLQSWRNKAKPRKQRNDDDKTDFGTVKKFSVLKLSPPTTAEEFASAKAQLEEIRTALIH